MCCWKIWSTLPCYISAATAKTFQATHHVFDGLNLHPEAANVAQPKQKKGKYCCGTHGTHLSEILQKFTFSTKDHLLHTSKKETPDSNYAV